MKKRRNPTSPCSVSASQFHVCNSCCSGARAPQPMMTSDEQSAICHWWAPAQKAFMTSVFSLEAAYRRNLKLSCALNLCWFMGVPSLPPLFSSSKKGLVAEQNWSRDQSILFPSDAGSTVLQNILKTCSKQPRRIAHVQRESLFWRFKADAPASVFLFSQRALAQTRWPQTFGTVLSFVRLRQVASLVRIYSSAPLARCKQAKFYGANTALGSRSMRILNATK